MLKENKVLNILYFFIFFGLISCSDDGEFSVELPDGVPPTSQVIGGVDGWLWVDCKTITTIKLECQIFDQKGRLSRTSFLMPCLNIQPHSKRPEPTKLDETIMYFNRVAFYEFKPSKFSSTKPKDNRISEKYYKLLGVDNSCNPASSESELNSVTTK